MQVIITPMASIDESSAFAGEIDWVSLLLLFCSVLLCEELDVESPNSKHEYASSSRRDLNDFKYKTACNRPNFVTKPPNLMVCKSIHLLR